MIRLNSSNKKMWWMYRWMDMGGLFYMYWFYFLAGPDLPLMDLLNDGHLHVSDQGGWNVFLWPQCSCLHSCSVDWIYLCLANSLLAASGLSAKDCIADVVAVTVHLCIQVHDLGVGSDFDGASSLNIGTGLAITPSIFPHPRHLPPRSRGGLGWHLSSGQFFP